MSVVSCPWQKSGERDESFCLWGGVCLCQDKRNLEVGAAGEKSVALVMNYNLHFEEKARDNNAPLSKIKKENKIIAQIIASRNTSSIIYLFWDQNVRQDSYITKSCSWNLQTLKCLTVKDFSKINAGRRIDKRVLLTINLGMSY